jgi:aryl-alcohol dehydrogenase-like predicted oxidoreductase
MISISYYRHFWHAGYDKAVRQRLPHRRDAQTTFAEGDIRNVLPRFHGEARQHNQRIAVFVSELAARKGVTPAQVALSWLLAQKPFIVPIPGTTKFHRLEENVGATEVILTADDLREIGNTLADMPVHGARYAEQGMKLIDP